MGKAKALKDLLHSSPHHFDKFDHQHMGSGEGAQVFGWGTYLSEGEPIQKYYRKQFIEQKMNQLFDKVRANPPSIGGVELKGGDAENFVRILRQAALHPDEKADIVQQFLSSNPLKYSRFKAEDVASELDRYLANSSFDPTIGLYKVDFNVDPADLLDLDRSIPAGGAPGRKFGEYAEYAINKGFDDRERELARLDDVIRANREKYEESLDLLNQGKITFKEYTELPDYGYEMEKARRAQDKIADLPDKRVFLNALTKDWNTSKDQLETIEGLFASPREVSTSLHKAGVPGSKYLDQPSRAKGEGTRNYVAFDEGDLEITDRQRGAADPKALAAIAAMTAATPQGRSLGGYIGNYIGGGITGTLDSLAGLADWASTSNTKPSYTDRGGYIPAGERIEALDTISETLADISERAKAWKEKKFGKNKIASTAGEILLGL